jgi:hypothetical protein
MTIRPPPPSGMYEVPDGGSTLAAEPRKVIRQAEIFYHWNVISRADSTLRRRMT